MCFLKAAPEAHCLRFRSVNIFEILFIITLTFLWNPSSVNANPAQIHTVALRCCNKSNFFVDPLLYRYNLLFANRTFAPLSPQTHSECVCVCRINQCPVRPSSSVVICWCKNICIYFFYNSKDSHWQKCWFLGTTHKTEIYSTVQAKTLMSVIQDFSSEEVTSQDIW